MCGDRSDKDLQLKFLEPVNTTHRRKRLYRWKSFKDLDGAWALTALAEDLGSIPSFQNVRLTIAPYSNARGSDVFFWHPRALAHIWCMNIHSGTHPDM